MNCKKLYEKHNTCLIYGTRQVELTSTILSVFVRDGNGVCAAVAQHFLVDNVVRLKDDWSNATAQLLRNQVNHLRGEQLCVTLLAAYFRHDSRERACGRPGKLSHLTAVIIQIWVIVGENDRKIDAHSGRVAYREKTEHKMSSLCLFFYVGFPSLRWVSVLNYTSSRCGRPYFTTTMYEILLKETFIEVRRQLC